VLAAADKVCEDDEAIPLLLAIAFDYSLLSLIPPERVDSLRKELLDAAKEAAPEFRKETLAAMYKENIRDFFDGRDPSK
jgi:hypothetical protein